MREREPPPVQRFADRVLCHRTQGYMVCDSTSPTGELPMFTRAIVSTDLGPTSEATISSAAALGALGVRYAVLVYVMDLDRAPSAADDEMFARQISSLESAGIRVSVETPLGYAPHAIVDMAERHAAGLVVMGTRGQGLFHAGFSGSVSSDVIRLSPVPVLLTPYAGVTTADEGTYARRGVLSSVLVPTDFSLAADRTFDLICALAPAGIERLSIVHVIQSTFEALRGGTECTARDRLSALATRARDAGVPEVDTEVVVGDPTGVVAQLAAAGVHSMIALAPRCLDAIDQQFGSVTNAVIQESTIPLLLTTARRGT
ncbi:MAG: universal stress protein [Coriobacteriia bacterium]|nr:universal stress protein [Coriobacteriia bacterium]